MAQQNTLDQKLDLYSRQNRTHRQRKKIDASSLLGYSVAAGMAMIVPDAMAAIVHNTTSIFVSISATSANTTRVAGLSFWDIDGDGNNDVNVSAFAQVASTTGALGLAGFNFSPYSGATSFAILSSFGGAKNLATSSIVQSPGTSANSSTSYLASNAGGSVSGTNYVSTNLVGNFIPSSTGYIGLRFGGGTGNAGPQFAWAKIRFDASGDANASMGPIHSGLTILEWAYDNSGAAIHVGDTVSAVPLPGAAGLMLLGMGSLGLTALRKRKQQYLEQQQAKTETA